jgi:hypothetical protein
MAKAQDYLFFVWFGFGFLGGKGGNQQYWDLKSGLSPLELCPQHKTLSENTVKAKGLGPWLK